MPATLISTPDKTQIQINYPDHSTTFQESKRITGWKRSFPSEDISMKGTCSATSAQSPYDQAISVPPTYAYRRETIIGYISQGTITGAVAASKIITPEMIEQSFDTIAGFRATRSELKRLREADSLPEILADLQSYESDASQYDEDYLKPTPFAFDTARTLLQGAWLVTSPYFPLGTLYPDGNGGIRIEWMRPDREISLVIRASQNEPSYIFCKEGQRYKGDYEITPELLGAYLNWLNHDERSSPVEFPMAAIA